MSGTADRIRSVTAELESTVARFIERERLPGASVGIVTGDELVWSFGYGFADVETERPSGPDVLYRIASITKTFTATAILRLRDEGRLTLDDPVTRHLPELERLTDPFGPVETITLRRLLSHESGVMTDPPGTEWWSRTYETNVATNLADAARIHAAVPPNTQTKYSNLAFQLLGEVVTRTSGVPYGDYVRTNLLEPLGMASTAYDVPPPNLAERCATGYAPRTFSDRLQPARPAKPPFSPVAEGGLWSSVHDLSRWISAHLRTDDDAGEPRVLAPPTLREMHTPRYLSDDTWTEAFCIGWYARRQGDEVWVQHSGGLPGFITNACFHPRERVGAIALLNGLGTASDLAMDLGGIALAAARTAVPAARAPQPLPEAFAPLLGFYVTPDEVVSPLRLEWRDGRLTFINPEDEAWRPTLSPTDEPWTFLVDPGVRESGEPVVFERTDDGRVRSVTVSSERMFRLDPVEE